mgnify:FL=1
MLFRSDPEDSVGDAFAGGPLHEPVPSAQGAAGGLFASAWSGGSLASVASAHTADYLASYGGAVTLDGDDGLLSAQSYGFGEAGYTLLGSPGAQSWSTGEAANDAEAFDYWVESLAL